MVQGELFREDPLQPQPLGFSEKSFFSRYQIAFSLDKLLIGALCILVSFILSYSLGIEKGKRYAEARIHMTLPSQETRAPLSDEASGSDSAATGSRGSGSDTIVLVPDTGTADETQTFGSETQAPLSETETVGMNLAAQTTNVPASLPQSSASSFPVADLSRRAEFTVQLVTYNREQMASSEIKRLEASGFHGFVIPSGSFYQVCANYFRNVSEAKSFLKRFQSSGRYPDAFIRPVVR